MNISYRLLMVVSLSLAAAGSMAAQTTTAPEPTIASLQVAAKAQPKDGPAQYKLALALQKAGKHREAVTAFDQAAALNFQPGAAQLRAAQSQVALGNQAEALRRVKALADAQPFSLAPILKAIGGIPQLEADAQFRAILKSAEAKRYPCRDSAQAHQFDFWIGEWNVADPTGRPLGVSSITHELEGCVVHEAWAGGLGGKGTSVNFFDPAGKKWHQVWTDDNGTITNYVGELRDGAMNFHAEGFGDADGVHHQRTLVFTPNKDGSVEQVFQDSDDGKDWKTTFDGHYVRAKP